MVQNIQDRLINPASSMGEEPYNMPTGMFSQVDLSKPNAPMHKFSTIMAITMKDKCTRINSMELVLSEANKTLKKDFLETEISSSESLTSLTEPSTKDLYKKMKNPEKEH